MKKLLVIMIALLTCLAVTLTIAAGFILSGRTKGSSPEPEETLALKETVSETETAPTEPPTTVQTETPTAEPTISKVETEQQTEPSQETEVPDKPDVRPLKRTVYATQRVNVRKGPAVSYESIGKLEKGSAAEQTGIADQKWSEIWFQGQKAYVASEYLTAEKPKQQEASQDTSFRKVNETVYSTGSIHLRSGPGKNYEAIGYLQPGDSAKRIGIGENGWSKLTWEGKTCYAFSQYLSVSPQKEPVESESKPVYREVDETVKATDNLNLRAGPGTDFKISAKLKKGQTVRRIAVGDNGWSEVILDGSRLYAASRYLTVTSQNSPQKEEMNPSQEPEESKPKPQEQKPAPVCKKTDKNMVAAEDLILHSGPDAGFSSQGKLSKGSLVHVTGICDNGWSRILLSGREVYVVTAYLKDEKRPEAAKPTEPTQPAETTETVPAETHDDYTKNEATIYAAADDVNIRSGPGTEHEKLGKLQKGTAVKRTAIGDDGWTRILYEGKDAYVKSSLLTEEPPSQVESGSESKQETAVYEEVDETVYSVDSVYIRTSPNTGSASLGSLSYGDSIRRTGIGSNGWSRVDWESGTAYASSKYLTTEKPEMPDFGETTTPGFPTPNSPFIYQYIDDPELIPYAIFEPADTFGTDPLPLIISLHGSAEVGQNREFMEGQHLTKVFREWEYTKLNAFDAFVVCPHLAKGVPIWLWQSKEGVDALYEIVDYMLENFDIDRDRIILEGHSMGAQGALKAAADPRSPFTKLVLGSGYSVDGVDYDSIQIPVRGYSGGSGPDAPKDDPNSYHFMNNLFKNHYGIENWYAGPYTHDDVAIQYFQKDEDEDGKSDIISWMLK